MSQVYEGIIAFSVLAAVVIFIWVMIDVKTIVRDAKRILETAESSLQTTTAELNQNLRMMKGLLEDLNAVTDNVRGVSASARMIGGNLQRITDDVRDAVGLVRGIPATASAEVAALKAGLRTGAMVFFKNLIWGVKADREGEFHREEGDKDGTWK